MAINQIPSISSPNRILPNSSYSKLKTIAVIALVVFALYAAYKIITTWGIGKASCQYPIILSTSNMRDIRSKKKHFLLSQIISNKVFAEKLDTLGLKVRVEKTDAYIDVENLQEKDVESIVVKNGLRSGCVYNQEESLIHKGEWGQFFESLEGLEIIVTKKNNRIDTYKCSFTAEQPIKSRHDIQISKQKLIPSQNIHIMKIVNGNAHPLLGKIDLRIKQNQNAVQIIANNNNHDASIQAITTVDTYDQRGSMYRPDGSNSRGVSTIPLQSIDKLKQIEITTTDGNITYFNLKVGA